MTDNTDKVQDYYFIHTNDFCSCCTFNYLLYKVLAKDKKDLVKKITGNFNILTKIAKIYYQPEDENEDVIEIHSIEQFNSLSKENGYLFSNSGLSFFDKLEKPFTYNDFVKYYENNEFLKDLTGDTLYLGIEESARKILNKIYSQPAKNFDYDTDELLGDIIFQGNRIYKHLDHTQSGIVNL